MRPLKIVFCSILTELLLILCIGCANLHPTPARYFFFYHFLYGILLSVSVPLFLLRREEHVSDFLGIKKPGRRQFIVLAIFVAVSVGGQLIPAAASGRVIPWDLLPMGVIPLVMTTFFEEFLFRGFFQTSFEKAFGALPAILGSGLMFSLYHLGYPGFRTAGDLLLLFAVGIGFAAAYRLSRNSLIVAYAVNLPNAFVTYLFRHDQFPVMDLSSTVTGILTLCILAAGFFIFANLKKRKQRASFSD